MTYDFVVVGGGIVGVATALEILSRRPGASLVLLEKESALALHQTGHNSGVIHSGIYYEPGTLKAVLCREGARRTKEFCREHGVPVRTCGKLLVATNALEARRLEALATRADVNGIEAHRVGVRELHAMEPHVRGLAALLVPETGVVDYTRMVRTMAELLESRGGEIRTGSLVVGISETGRSVCVTTEDGQVLEARTLVACAGLQADRVAHLAGLALDLQIVPFRGEYYQLPRARADLVHRLIYPVPDPRLPFLGVHLSPTIDGDLTVGPNAVLGLSREGYERFSFNLRDVRAIATFPGMWRLGSEHARTAVREMRNSVWRRAYLAECRKFCPELTLDDLQPKEAGIRAQVVLRNGHLVHDFVIRETPRSVHVLNAPSPAATSALPIGARIAEIVVGRAA